MNGRTIATNVLNSLRQVFSKPIYLSLAATLSAIVLVFSIWLPNLHIISNTVTSSHLTLVQKTDVLTGFLEGFVTNFTPLSRALTITTAVLFGMNISLLVYYFKFRYRFEKEAGMSLVGIASGMLGVGCASCGSVILTSLFGFGTTAGVIGLLPLRGSEFALLGIGFLLISITILSQKIQDPVICNPVRTINK